MILGIVVAAPAAVRSAKPPEPAGKTTLDPKIQAALKKLPGEPRATPERPAQPRAAAPPCRPPDAATPPPSAPVDPGRRVPAADKQALRRAVHDEALARINQQLAHDAKALGEAKAELRRRLLGGEPLRPPTPK